MSYDIFFWREVPGANLDPERVFHELEDGLGLAGVIPIPLKTVMATFQQHFPGIQECEGVLDWTDRGSFQVSFTWLDEQTITLGTIYCGPDLNLETNPATVQGVAQVVIALGCRAYDPN